MKFLKLFVLLSVAIISINANHENNKKTSSYDKPNNIKVAYFASGCFWCVEAIFESVKGVKEAISGYAGGNTLNPTYQKIGTGNTGHAETVAVYYDPKIVCFQMLVHVFFGSQDPTIVNGQHPDYGTQYRSIAFYNNEVEKNIIESTIKELNKTIYNGGIVTEVTKLQKFYPAEPYHQDFEKRNPNQPYVKSVSIPRLNRFKAKFPELLKEQYKKKTY